MLLECIFAKQSCMHSATNSMGVYLGVTLDLGILTFNELRWVKILS